MSKRKFDAPKLLPKRAQRVIERVRCSETLCRRYRSRAVGETDEVATGALAACGSGLFGDGNARNYTTAVLEACS